MQHNSKAEATAPVTHRCRISYLGPVADEVVIDAGELDDFRIVAAEPRDKSLNRGVEIEYHAARMGVADHALQPEERSNAHAARDRRDRVQAGCRIKHQCPAGSLTSCEP